MEFKYNAKTLLESVQKQCPELITEEVFMI